MDFESDDQGQGIKETGMDHWCPVSMSTNSTFRKETEIEKVPLALESEHGQGRSAMSGDEPDESHVEDLRIHGNFCCF